MQPWAHQVEWHEEDVTWNQRPCDTANTKQSSDCWRGQWHCAADPTDQLFIWQPEFGNKSAVAVNPSLLGCVYYRIWNAVHELLPDYHVCSPNMNYGMRIGCSSLGQGLPEMLQAVVSTPSLPCTPVPQWVWTLSVLVFTVAAQDSVLFTLRFAK